MQVRLLGPLDVVAKDGPVALGGPKERAVLAVLALSANRVVSEDVLVDALWGDSPPRTATKTVRSYVSRLRGAFAEAATDDDGPVVAIESSAGGYVLRVDPGGLDVDDVTTLVEQARDAASRGDHAWATVAFAKALRTWRGPALQQLADEPFARIEARRLDELGESVAEGRIDAELACGHHLGVAGELEAMTAAHPMRERFWAQRMVALYRCGRQAEALRVYQELRSGLVEELGIEPSPALAALEKDILRQDPSLDWVAPSSAAGKANQDLPSGVLTFLLTDVVGSAALWDRYTDAMAEAMATHDNLIRHIVILAGGNILKTKGEGDATMSVFRRPSDAVATAWALRRELNAQTWPADLDLKVRIALNTGEAFERDDDYFGPTVNRSARLRSVAFGDQVLLSQTTADLVIDHLPHDTMLVDRGLFELRGLARNERVFELIRAEAGISSGVDELTLPLPPGLRTDGLFVGREEAAATLRGLWNDAVAGKRRLGFVAGEPGIGKTRLAAEVAAQVRHDGVVLFGRCDEDLGVPYQPFAAALSQFVADCPSERQRTLLGPLAGELVRILPDLAEQLPGLPAPIRADAETERQRVFNAIASWLSTASQITPILLVIDDLHWAAEPTLLMLRHLLRSELPMSLLVLCTYRDTELDRLHPLAAALAEMRRGEAVQRMVLGGLDSDAAAMMVESVVGRALETDELGLAAQLHAQTGGNPFFMHEVMRHLADSGANDVALPEGVREVITRRLAHLSEDANRALAVASIVGQAFALGLLERIPEAATNPSTLLDALDEAVRSRLVVEVDAQPGHYAFAHALIRQTIDHELTATRRARLHRRVGEALETLPNPSLFAEALAFHFAEAALDGQIDKAADYALEAANRAIEHLAYEDSVGHLERGLAALELDTTPDVVRRIDIDLALARARWALGNRVSARDAALVAARAAKEFGDGNRLAEACILLTTVAETYVKDEDIRTACDAALELVDQENVALRARLLAGIATFQFVSEGMPELGRATAVEALRLARTIDDPTVLAAALYARAATLFGSPLVHEALAAADEWVALASATNDVAAWCNALIMRGCLHVNLGDRAALTADLEVASRLAVDNTLWRMRPYTTLGHAALALFDGRFDEAGELIARTLGEVGTDRQAMAMNAVGMVMLMRDSGQTELLRSVGQAGLQNFPDATNVAAGLAMIQAAAGDEVAARVSLAEALAHDLAIVPRDFLFNAILTVLAEACALLSDREAAALVQSHLSAYSGFITTISIGTVSFGAVDRYLGMLAATCGDWDEAEAKFDRALEQEARLEAPAFIARTRFWYAQMLLARNESDDSPRATELLKAALATAQTIGIADIAQQAEQLLADA